VAQQFTLPPSSLPCTFSLPSLHPSLPASAFLCITPLVTPCHKHLKDIRATKCAEASQTL
jgi:hypothetical protein